jgi:hypothetical protein
LAGLVAASASEAPDLEVHLQGDPPPALGSAREVRWIRLRDTDSSEETQEWRLGTSLALRLRFAIERRGVEFTMDPAQVWVRWADALRFDDVASFLVGPVLGRVLRLRGVPCLHASVVAIDGRAIAIVGSKAAGKSTTAAGLARNGCPVLSDDIAALTENGTTFVVQPGCQRLRLWAPAIAAFYGSRDDLPRVQSNRNKRYLDLSPDEGNEAWRFQPDPLPLAAIYVLGARSARLRTPICRALSVAQGLMALTANSYASHILDRASRAREFACLARLARRVPVRQVERPDEMRAVDEVCAMVRADVRQLRTVGSR